MGSLTSVGALASTASSSGTSSTLDWRPGNVANVDGSTIDVAEPYVLLVSFGALARYDLVTRARVPIAFVPGVSTTPHQKTAIFASNGDVVIGGLANALQRYRDGVLAPLPGEPASTEFVDGLPRTDGNFVTYRKSAVTAAASTYQTAMNDGASEILLGKARVFAKAEIGPDPTLIPLARRDYDVNNGWIAYTELDASNRPRVWLRSATGMLRQISQSATPSFLSSLGPDGTVFFVSGGRRYRCPPGGTPSDVSGANGEVIWRTGQPYLKLGITVFRIR